VSWSVDKCRRGKEKAYTRKQLRARRVILELERVARERRRKHRKKTREPREPGLVTW
jgi:hypothetical protein